MPTALIYQDFLCCILIRVVSERLSTLADMPLYSHAWLTWRPACLYIGTGNSSAFGLDYITCDIPTLSDATESQTNCTISNGTSVGGMHIDTTDDMFGQVHVVKNATSGFALYGKQLIYYDETTIQSQFWAKEIAETDGSRAWVLYWNSNNNKRPGAVPVALKTIATSL